VLYFTYLREAPTEPIFTANLHSILPFPT